jgi:SAM-dependent methyltransferase
MPQKKGLDLNRVVLLGRTFEEYLRFFAFTFEELSGKSILDVASGVSSFTAEGNSRGLNVTAFDRIYSMGAEEIRQRCEHDLSEVTRNIGEREVYRWDFYKSPEGMRQFRDRAYKTFLADFVSHPERYVAGELPNAPFGDLQFDLTLVSYLLFVYEDQLSYEFHNNSIRELMRVTRGEIRIYPIVTFEAERSRYLSSVRGEPEFASWSFEEVPTDFEFLRNSNSYLKIRRR